jgi:transcriptional regulator with XRE-family HTH domain
MENIIDQLKKAVTDAEEAGWSMNRIAKEAGVSRPSLAEWIHGSQKNVSLETAAGVAAWLGMRLTKARIPKPE